MIPAGGGYRGFIGFIKPRKYEGAKSEEVGGFLRRPGGEGKEIWFFRKYCA